MRTALLLVAGLTACVEPPADNVHGAPRFRKHVLDTAFRAEGVAVLDVNHDGVMDIATDQFWYEGPAFLPHEIRTPESWDPEFNYSANNATFAADLDGDGFEDLLVVPFPGNAMSWYQNPAGQVGHWTPHLLYRSATVETPTYTRLTNTPSASMIMGVEPEQILGWFEPDRDPYSPWILHPISGSGFPQAARYEHGLGVGDVNGDGRRDVLTASGWFEAPLDPTAGNWIWHAVPFAPGECAQMYVYDVDADGLPDVLCSSSHHYGVWWWQQAPAAAGAEASFVPHVIDSSFSESHAMRFEDLDGDGVPELITGKRFYSHGKMEPGALDPAVLVYYRLDRRGASPQWVRHLVDDDSGVGTQFEVKDVNGDGKPDIVVSNKKGLFYFEQE